MKANIFIGAVTILQLLLVSTYAQHTVVISSNKNNTTTLDSMIGAFNSKAAARSQSSLHDVDGKIKLLRQKAPTITNVKEFKYTGISDKFKLYRNTNYFKKLNDARNLLNSNAQQLQSLKDPNLIMNSKFIRHYKDSIEKTLPGASQVRKIADLQKSMSKTVTQQQLVDNVNQKFQAEGNDMKDSLSRNEFSDSVKNVRSKIDLVHSTLDPSEMANGGLVRSRMIKTKYLRKLDSIRSANLSKERLILSEKQGAVNMKIANVKSRQTFWQKSYFEALATLSQAFSKQIQFSPAYAYHFHPMFSLGVGPSVLINWQQTKTVTTVGGRVFGKAEFINRLLYAQIEDQFLPNASGAEGRYTQQKVYVGIGGLLPVFHPLAINVALFYNCISNVQQPNSSPWLLRVGISTNKKSQ